MADEEEILVNINIELSVGNEPVTEKNILLFRNHETYDALTNLNGVAKFYNIPVGVYKVKVEYEGYKPIKIQGNGSETDDTITVGIDQENFFYIYLLEVDECNKLQSRSRHCKRFHQEPYWTPNNYELYFDYNNIPVNIGLEKFHDLRKRLQKQLPLSKILHLNLEMDSVQANNECNLYTKTYIKFKRKNSNGKTIKYNGELR